MIQLNTTYTDLKAFLHGYKPAFIFTPHYIPRFYEPHDVEKLLTYPCIQQIKPHNKPQDIYFQNEALKHSFQTKIKDLDHNAPEFHRILGESLGFPPKAVAYYVNELQGLTDRNRRIGYEYNGVNFIGSIDTMIECVYWLWKRYPQSYFRERELEISYGKPSTYFKIAYKDTQRLNTVFQEICNRMTKKRSASITL